MPKDNQESPGDWTSEDSNELDRMILSQRALGRPPAPKLGAPSRAMRVATSRLRRRSSFWGLGGDRLQTTPDTSVVGPDVPQFSVSVGGHQVSNARLEPAMGRLEDASVYEELVRQQSGIRSMMSQAPAGIYREPPKFNLRSIYPTTTAGGPVTSRHIRDLSDDEAVQRFGMTFKDWNKERRKAQKAPTETAGASSGSRPVEPVREERMRAIESLTPQEQSVLRQKRRIAGGITKASEEFVQSHTDKMRELYAGGLFKGKIVKDKQGNRLTKNMLVSRAGVTSDMYESIFTRPHPDNPGERIHDPNLEDTDVAMGDHGFDMGNFWS